MKVAPGYDTVGERAPAAERKGYSDVLALVTSSGPWSPAAFAGVDIAAMFDAHVTGCYVDPSLRSLRGIDDEPTVIALLMDEPRGGDDGREVFAAFAHSRGVRHVSWMSTRVAPAKTMRALGAWHDLIVIERDLPEEPMMVDVLGEALLTCRAPCLVLPPQYDNPFEIKKLVVAWNGSIEAIRATHAALPLARLAEHVLVLRDGAMAMEDDDRLPPFDPVLYLRLHGVNVSEQPIHASPLNAGPAILSTALQFSADCLVMGAYGHPRVRERILGGATRHLLQHADLPLFMQH